LRLQGLPGWVWNVNDAEWEHGYSVLQQFVARVGHARVPYKHLEGDYPLGRWVVKQRHKRDEQTPERARRLEALDGWVWATRSARGAKAPAKPPGL
jgi:hypothetical protein